MEQLKGTISSIIFRNAENGWTVMELMIDENERQLHMTDLDKDESQGLLFTAVGCMPLVSEGELIELYGEWIEHKNYGRQFKFQSGVSTMPQTLIGIEKYLASGLIKGIGPATARIIVNTFGESTFDIFDNEPERLALIKGISKKKASKISESYKEQSLNRTIMINLQSLGLSNSQAIKLLSLYGEDAISLLRQNPYRLVDDVEGIGFRTADKIAQSMGFAEDSSFRVCAGIKYAMNWARTDCGHTCYPIDSLIDIAARSLECDAKIVENNVRQLIVARELINITIGDKDFLFLPWLYHCESKSAHKLLELDEKVKPEAGFDLEQELRALEAEKNIVLDSQQRRAVLASFERGVLVITGGPGTGKTTIINFILMLMDKLGLEAQLCAPTGRAAKRMSETTGCESKTIHRLLEYTGELFLRDSDMPIEADVLIVDEMSMVDVWLLFGLLEASKEGTRLILVGDADQLPSVGAGNVLKDIIDSSTVEVVRLTEIFRQASLSRIVVNAHRINSGEMPLLDFVEDFAFEQLSRQEDILKRLAGICQRGILGNPMVDLQLLSPTKKGILGVKNINYVLQSVLNPADIKKEQKEYGDTIFRVCDKVMQVKNNYSLEWVKPAIKGIEQGSGVFNGDMGIIKNIYHDDNSVEVLFDDERTVMYGFKDLAELELAYCISIHKSQGSEFSKVLLPLAGGPPQLLTRNLLYTAITRAKNCVVILGRRDCISSMVDNKYESERFSSLKHTLISIHNLYAK